MKLKTKESKKILNLGLNKRDFIAKVPEDEEFDINTLSSFKDAKILVVEDNEINLKVLLKVLEHSQISIKTAKNGQEALEILATLNPEDLDLILMDINMPIMDGYRATTLIRQDSKWQNIPIVALSALNLDKEIAKMAEVGMDAFLPKPLNLKQLSTIFKKYLNRLYKEQTKSSKVINLDLKLNGLDLNSALSGVGGDIDILKDMLLQFKREYQYSNKKIEFYIQVQKYNKLQKILVDLIGLSGSIGAKKLFELSKQMYKDFIFSRFEEIMFKLPEFSKELERVCSLIDTFLEKVS